MSQLVQLLHQPFSVRWFLRAIVTATALLAVACGGSDLENTAPGTGSDDDLSSVSATLFPDQAFTFEDYLAAGWKKSKQYTTETVPEATDIWYGFFKGKDIEVRFYNSHEIASTAGLENAAAAIDQSFREGGKYGSSNRGAGSHAVTKYKAFAVVGDTVMLCEQSVDVCIELANVLGG
jgi:hypothetical protein